MDGQSGEDKTYSYSDIITSSNGGNQNQIIHGHMVNQFEIYNQTTGMMMMSYPSISRNNNNNLQGFFNNKPPSGPGPSKELNVPTTSDDQFYHHELKPWNNDDEDHDPYNSLRSSCHVFSCEGNERPSHGLSLSLSSSTVTLQSFELRQQQFGIKNSRYLRPAQDLLAEFCNLGINEDDHHTSKLQKTVHEDDAHTQPLHSLDLLQLQIRKSKLIQLVDEVDRRYKHYCNKMKAVSSTFEEVAGNGAAAVYSAMAAKAMSRHFRCLRDGIVSQLKATKKAIDDKNTTTCPTGTRYAMKGETPRLRLLDQRLRQQKALQQMSLMETHPWRPQRGLPERSVSALRAWLFEHFLHPYPSDVDKHILSRQTGLSRSQVSNWFINARVRLWKPMVEEMYSAEVKENLDRSKLDDTKETLDQRVRKDYDTLSSIINNPDKNGDSYGAAMELDFSSYGGGGGGVSLTLGLHQHAGNGGVSSSSSLFYPRDQMEDCTTVHHQDHQYTLQSLLDNDQTQILQYRNLMGAQLLHDLAG